MRFSISLWAQMCSYDRLTQVSLLSLLPVTPKARAQQIFSYFFLKLHYSCKPPFFFKFVSIIFVLFSLFFFPLNKLTIIQKEKKSNLSICFDLFIDYGFRLSVYIFVLGESFIVGSSSIKAEFIVSLFVD